MSSFGARIPPRRGAKLSTRLLLPLLAVVTVVMLAYAVGSLRQREGVMVSEEERETRAYANALGLALERAVGRGDPDAVQEMIDRIDRDPNIYGVFVYDTTGSRRFVSSPLADAAPAPPSEVRSVLPKRGVRTSRRDVLGEASVSVLRPLLAESGEVRGVLEVIQPLTSVRMQLTGTRQRFLLNTLTLIVAVTLILTWLVRRHLSQPLSRFVESARALGGGELTHRLDPDMAVGELAEVAEELNRMADRLEQARVELVREGEERVSLERRLLQTEKLAEVGRLAAGLAHEIGAPLHVIRGRADLILKNSHQPDTRDRNLGIIIRQIDRITLIVRNLLDYSRRREPRMIAIDLVAVVKSVVEFLDVEAVRHGARLTHDVQDEPLPVTGDPDLLHQVFLNVLLNAFHAVDNAGRPGTIEIRIRGEETDVGTRAVVDIADDGAGIPPELRDRVFEPFYTTKEGGRGTGLGLALARGIVDDHGGAIAIVGPAKPGWSTCVRIVLPMSSEPLWAPSSDSPSSQRSRP